MGVIPRDFWTFEPWQGWAAQPAYVAEILGLRVRVNEEVRKTVVFVGQIAGGKFMPRGTGFLVSMSRGQHSMYFLATADHVIDLITGDQVAVRFNKKGGGITGLILDKNYKIPHPNRQNDIALFNVPDVYQQADCLFIELDRAELVKSRKDIWNPGLGDEVATVGLYSSHYGETKNIPLVRVGHIAMMPDEPVLTQRGYISGYLVETKSIVGLSGSPVFVNVPNVRVDGKGQLQRLTNPTLIPMGMMLGYHLVASVEDQITVPQMQGAGLPAAEKEQDPGLSLDERNTGLAVVVPYERLLDMAESDDFNKRWDAAVAMKLKGAKFRPAGVVSDVVAEAPKATDANPQHREDFDSLMRNAAKKQQ